MRLNDSTANGTQPAMIMNPPATTNPPAASAPNGIIPLVDIPSLVEGAVKAGRPRKGADVCQVILRWHRRKGPGHGKGTIMVIRLVWQRSNLIVRNRMALRRIYPVIVVSGRSSGGGTPRVVMRCLVPFIFARDPVFRCPDPLEAGSRGEGD